jgi:hypothetical protein
MGGAFASDLMKVSQEGLDAIEWARKQLGISERKSE